MLLRNRSGWKSLLLEVFSIAESPVQANTERARRQENVVFPVKSVSCLIQVKGEGEEVKGKTISLL